MLKLIFGYLLILTSIGDAWKYTIQARRVQKEKSSQNLSRRFINLAVLNDCVKLGYGFVIRDIFIILTSIMALVCMIDLWYQIYWWYCYETYPKRIKILRPNIFVYLWNSILPNHIRKHL